MTTDCAADFVELLRMACTPLGGSVSVHGGRPTLQGCGPAELSSLLAHLQEAGYSIVSSRPTSWGTELGVMLKTDGVPEFFRVELGRSSITFPQTDGLLLAFLGPDGVGKTTTVANVMSKLRTVFDDQHLFHWRPQIIKPRSEQEVLEDKGWMCINRHGEPPRSPFVSLIRLAGVFLDYHLGHQRLIAPALERGGLVIFDRYYHDILVDSKRYRYGGPQWLLPLMKTLLPHRKVFFVVLDAEEKVILSRKQEVSPEELRLQRRKYASLSQTLPCLHVRTDNGIEQTLREVLIGIGLHLTHSFDEKLQRVKNLPVPASAAATSIGVPKTA